jgi:hypothetical protein
MSQKKEPCAGCGEETATGSPFYSDRRVVRTPDGHPSFVCSLCAERAAIGRRRKRLTAEEIEQLTKNGSMAMIAASGGMH